ncbi:MAG: hypothetical protein NOU37_03430 [Candidatus Brocadiales bacterium]|nr:hypothetical protein [Candidatus Bathyanammoxibius amoris]
MQQEITSLIKILKRDEQKFSNVNKIAFNKFQKWCAYIERIIQGSGKNPNIISMAFVQKLIAYMGIIDSLKLSSGSSRKNIVLFFDKLDENEKFLTMMAVQVGRTETGSNLQGHPSKKKQREEEIVHAYLTNNSRDLEKFFRKIILSDVSLYGLRSVLVHEGGFVISMVDSAGSILASYSPNMALKIDENIMSLDEMFLRGFCRIVDINTPPLKSRAKTFLQRSRYAAKTPEYLQLFESKFS